MQPKKSYSQIKHEVTEARKARGQSHHVFTGVAGRISPTVMVNVSARWKQRKKHVALSHDIIVGKANATDVATRLATRELTRPLREFNLGPEEKTLVQQIVQHRTTVVPKSTVPVRLETDLLLLMLANRVGIKETNQILGAVSKRAIQIQKMANHEVVSKEAQTDAFSNIGPNLDALRRNAAKELSNKADFLARIEEIIQQKLATLKEVKAVHDPERRARLEAILRKQLEVAVLESTKFKLDHSLF